MKVRFEITNVKEHNTDIYYKVQSEDVKTYLRGLVIIIPKNLRLTPQVGDVFIIDQIYLSKQIKNSETGKILRVTLLDVRSSKIKYEVSQLNDIILRQFKKQTTMSLKQLNLVNKIIHEYNFFDIITENKLEETLEIIKEKDPMFKKIEQVFVKHIEGIVELRLLEKLFKKHNIPLSYLNNFNGIYLDPYKKLNENILYAIPYLPLDVLSSMTNLDNTQMIELNIYYTYVYMTQGVNKYILKTEFEEQLKNSNLSVNFDTCKLIKVVGNGQYVVDSYIYKMESTIYNRLVSQNSKIDDFYTLEDIPDHAREFLSDEQQNAIISSLNQKYSVITGSAGTGKSTTTASLIETIENKVRKKYIELEKITDKSESDFKKYHTLKSKITKGHQIAYYHQKKLTNYILSSPTGAAADVLARKTKKTSLTISKLNTQYKYYRTSSREKFLIIDETSMLDLFQLYFLFNYLHEDTQIIFIGDIKQLPAVQYGFTLKNIINIGVPTNEITKVYRQTKEVDYDLPDLIYDVLNKKPIKEVHNSKLSIINSNNINVHTILEQVKDMNFEDFKTMNFNLITPMNVKTSGVDALNVLIQSKLNDISTPKFIDNYGRIFNLGDKVIQIQNDNELKLYNGNMGTVVKVHCNDPSELLPGQTILTINVGGKLFKINEGQLRNLDLAYAITIHKAQGGEWDFVFLTLDGDNPMLCNELIYTAITRAKKKLILMTNLDKFNEKIKISLQGVVTYSDIYALDQQQDIERGEK